MCTDIHIKNVKAVLFDSGRVLNYPRSGNWFIPPKFFEYVDKNTFNRISTIKKNHAFKAAHDYINSCKLIKTQEEEYRYFIEYYNIFFRKLPELNLKTKNIKCIAEDLVYNKDKYVFYDEVKSIVDVLSKRYKLGVVSDAWPSLSMVFEEAGLRNYFSAFVISSKIGAVKPESVMYSTALDELNVLPKDAIFIDDNLKNCIGAGKLGIHPVLLCRNKSEYFLNKILRIGKEYRVVNNFQELLSKLT